MTTKYDMLHDYLDDFVDYNHRMEKVVSLRKRGFITLQEAINAVFTEYDKVDWLARGAISFSGRDNLQKTWIEEIIKAI